MTLTPNSGLMATPVISEMPWDKETPGSSMDSRSSLSGALLGNGSVAWSEEMPSKAKSAMKIRQRWSKEFITGGGRVRRHGRAQPAHDALESAAGTDKKSCKVDLADRRSAYSPRLDRERHSRPASCIFQTISTLTWALESISPIILASLPQVRALSASADETMATQPRPMLKVSMASFLSA